MWVTVLMLGLVSAAADELPLRCRDARCRYIGKYQFDEHRYQVDDKELWVIHGDPGGYLRIRCGASSVLESSAMPRADPALSVWNLNMAYCQLPAAGSLVNKLADLNITMRFNQTDSIEPHGKLTIQNLPPMSLITTKHFAGLESLVSLQIYAYTNERVSSECCFLSLLQSLQQLEIQYVTLHADELDTLSPSLHELSLIHTSVERLPEAVYSSPSLRTLKIESKSAVNAVAVPPELRSLDLQSPATTLRLDAVPALEKLALTHWTEPQPPPLTRCDSLRKLHLTAPAVHTLPYGWLANCSNLEELVVQNARSLNTLQRMFGTFQPSLSLIAFKEGVLETLSERQFHRACLLCTIELNSNRLRTIPSDALPSLPLKLDLSSNDLDGGVLDVVGKIADDRLTALNLADNPRLGDVCGKNGFSPLRNVTLLTALYLNKTNVTRICRDWRENLTLLKKLDLRDTSVATLSFEDLQFKRIVPAEVLLLGAPVTLLEMTRLDFLIAKSTPTSDAFVYLDVDMKLQCDCRMYWTRRVLDRSPHVLAQISVLRCASGQELQEVSPEEMECARPEECTAAALPAACACTVQPDEDADQSWQLVRVHCEHAGLHRVPRLPASEEHQYELLLAHNMITDLHANELYHTKGLDLRNNSIRRVDEETATRLGSIGGMLRLAGNPLECDCRAAPLLQALHSRALGYTDLGNATCSDGTALNVTPIVDCPPSVSWLMWLVGALVVLFIFAVTIIIYLASRERRFFVKAVMHRWGLWRAEMDADDRPYDAFVSFSHKDEAVVRELVTRLEPPYRLCLHYRDWIPGLLIPEQIVESVQESRRTVALVSRHFLASTWTRAEFREAHAAAMLDARPRLIVVLLEEPAALALDDQLQRYITSHTYLRWGDPWFWNKLAVALPRPRQSPVDPDAAPFVSLALAQSTPCEFPAPTVLALPPPTVESSVLTSSGSPYPVFTNPEPVIELAPSNPHTVLAVTAPVIPPLTKLEEKRSSSDVRMTLVVPGSSSAVFTNSESAMELMPRATPVV